MSLDAARLATAPRSALATEAYRNQAPQYDPRSGEGARIHGGRFNPAGSFPVLYLCETRPCAVAELHRLGARHLVGVEGLLPRVLFRYSLDLDQVLDLTSGDVIDHIGVSEQDLTGEDWTLCQRLGTEAYAAGVQGLRTWSATGVDRVLAVFPELLGGGMIDVELVERWEHVTDL
jgi:RES domain-containing protein